MTKKKKAPPEKSGPKVRSAFSKGARVQQDFSGDSPTRQEFREECDINRIVDRFMRTGQVTHLAQVPGQFLDVSNVQDYRTALDNVRAAHDVFMTLPAKVRQGFNNDASEFLDRVVEMDQDELLELGLVKDSGSLDAESVQADAASKPEQGAPEVEDIPQADSQESKK